MVPGGVGLRVGLGVYILGDYVCNFRVFNKQQKMFGMGAKLRIKGYLDGIITITRKGYIF